MITEAFPVGSVFISTVSTNPSTLLGYGTWVGIGAGRVLVGLDSGDTDFDTEKKTGGAKTISAAGTNSAPTFTGDALSAHSHGVGTYATSAHSGTAVGDHASHVHSGSADHASHTHDYSQVINHTHTINITDNGHAHAQRRNNTTTGANSGWTTAFDTSSSSPVSDSGTGTATATTGITASSDNPSGGVATGTTLGPSASLSHGNTGNPTTTLSHSVTQPANHTLSGVSESVTAGTPSGTISSPTFTGSPTSVVQPYIVVRLWERTA